MHGCLQRFRPMSLEKPKVLLPLVGVPMINYTLEWLASNKVAKASASLRYCIPLNCMGILWAIPCAQTRRCMLQCGQFPGGDEDRLSLDSQ
jgi:hypothetical protein